MLKYYKIYKGSFHFYGSCDTIEEEINHLLCDRFGDTPIEIISTVMRITDNDIVEIVILYYEG